MKKSVEIYLAETNKNQNNPQMFWKVNKSVSGAVSSNELAKRLGKESINLTISCAVLIVDAFEGTPRMAALHQEPAIANSPVDCFSYLEPVSTSEVYQEFKGGY